ncbi:MAG TPA: PQQ-binding-like beta-propeller repeat protein, partial [Candidatus Acidoferrum sp.]|nr:PQQ-binding-like beta-propeller repeat protein [Candidatus Acidoferrum sp.]
MSAIKPLLLCTFATLAATAASGQVQDFAPVTQQTLENPDPADWLMVSRTYDSQRFSPLTQITTANVGGLTMKWSKLLGTGTTETVPLVYRGVMYVVLPNAIVEALDARNGDVLWKYQRKVSDSVGGSARTKGLAIYDDVIVYDAPDSYVVGLDARTGAQRWETKAGTRGHTSAPLIVNGIAVSGGACFGNRDNCYLSANDIHSGEELWRFYTTPKAGEPGDDTWHGAELSNRQASTWGLPGSYDVKRKLLIWGIANAMPDRRAARHNGDADGTGYTTPADLYSNSTVALDAAHGKLQWYYQHLPGDDWDFDATHERTLVTTKVAPDPRYVKWINPAIKPGETLDIAVMISEGGGLWALDRDDGKFLWAMPFPFDAPEWWLDTIDPATGKVTIKKNLVFRTPGERKTLCYWNTRSYWPTAYSPQTNSLYTSYIDVCRDLTSATATKPESWQVVPRPGTDPDQITGLAKIDLATG